MTTRREMLIAVGASAVTAPFASVAQQSRIYRVGILSSTNAANSPNVRAFTQGMEKLGWIDGKNISMEYRYAEGNVDRLPALAVDIVQRKVDVIVTLSAAGTQAARRAAGTIPIVFATLSNPVGMGFVASLARPGGNITGISAIGLELNAKRVQLLKDAIPKISRIAVVSTGEPANRLNFAEIQRAAKALGMEVLEIKVRSRNDLAEALALLRKWRADAMYVMDASVNFNNRAFLAKFAAENRFPMIAGTAAYVEAGGFISYGANYEDQARRAAILVDKILKGAKPADLPVEQATQFDLVINMKTAKALGLTVPQPFLMRVDRVIE